MILHGVVNPTQAPLLPDTIVGVPAHVVEVTYNILVHWLPAHVVNIELPVFPSTEHCPDVPVKPIGAWPSIASTRPFVI
jgi:hypothetical protein